MTEVQISTDDAMALRYKSLDLASCFCVSEAVGGDRVDNSLRAGYAVCPFYYYT